MPVKNSNCARAAFQVGEHCFKGVACGVPAAGVIVSGRFSGFPEAEVRGLVEGCSDRSVFGIGVRSSEDGACFLSHECNINFEHSRDL